MHGSRLLAVVASAVLSVPASPALAAPAPTPSPDTPCPVAGVVPPVAAPPRPSPPARDARRRAVGGDALATTGLTVPPQAPALPTTLTATSWVVADLDTGAVVGACGPHQHAVPASVQKLLLAAAVLPKLDPAQVVEVTAADLAIERGSSAVGLLEGGRYPVELLWLGLLLQSGNDAANALARVAGGEAGVPGTLAEMNALARRLGALETRAVTPSGLDGPGQFTSAYDLALIARVCFAREDFRRYALTERVKVPPQPPRDAKGFEIQNENRLIFQYPGALGGKTGFTELARHSYVGAAERGGRRLVVTLLGAEARPARGWQQGAALLDWGFAQPAGASVGRLVEPGETDRPTVAPKAAGAGAATRGGAGGGAEVGPAANPGAAATVLSNLRSPTTAGGAAVAATLIVLATVMLVRRGRTRRRRSVGPAGGTPTDGYAEWDRRYDRSI